jgi:uncharacterized protein YcbK (DUF882 family)
MKHLAITAFITIVVAFVSATMAHARPLTALRKPSTDARKPSGDVWLYAENLGEQVRVNIYKADGTFDDAALAKLDELFRCKRTGEVRAVRPELYEKLSQIFDRFGGKRVELISGFRFDDKSSSRHFHASAMDIRVPGASLGAMHRYALSLDRDERLRLGIGLYPSGSFIHVDIRAPGEPSYRWTDGQPTKKPARTSKPRTVPARRPTS